MVGVCGLLCVVLVCAVRCLAFFVVCWLLFGVRSSVLVVVWCSLCAVCCWLCAAVCGLVFVICRALCVVWCFGVWCVMFVECCVLVVVVLLYVVC